MCGETRLRQAFDAAVADHSAVGMRDNDDIAPCRNLRKYDVASDVDIVFKGGLWIVAGGW
jgi:hypothetical protein